MIRKIKNNKFFSWKVLVVFLFAGFLLYSTTGCRPAYNKETMQKMDTLQNYVNKAGEILIIDDKLIKSRRDSINRRMDFVKHNYTGTISLELQAALTKLMAIRKNYNRFVQNYPELEKEQEEHKKRLDNLQKDLAEGRLSEAEFEKIYIKEKNVLSKYLESVKLTAQSVYLIENDYRRVSRDVDGFINSVIEHDKKAGAAGK